MDEEEELQKLIEEHKLCSTERAKVVCENRMWEIAKASKGVTISRPFWLETTLGYKENYKYRENLQDAPPELWDHVEATKLALPKAVILWKEVLAKKEVRKQQVIECLRIILREKKEQEDAKAAKRAERIHSKISKIPEISVLQEGWSEVQQALENCLAPVLTIMSPTQKTRYIPRFNRSIQLAITSLYTTLKRDADAVEAMPVSILALKEACTSLQVITPEYKKPVDLAEAKKNKRILLSMVHPDKTPTPDLDLYQEYLQAYDTLEKYNNQLAKYEKEEEKLNG